MELNNSSVIIAAPAKINLVLEINGTDSEGYHELSTIFQALELADELFITKATETKLNIVDRVHSGFKIDLDENNLVIKAQRALELYCQRSLPCHIRLIKSIPAGGGLGGGSADAAAMLRALNNLYDLRLSRQNLIEIASKIGADVAFGVMGGTALGQGRGEKLTPLPTTLNFYKVLLLIPEKGLSTPKVYAKWDTMPEEKRSVARGQAQKFVDMIKKPGSLMNATIATLSNDLQPAAFELYPELAKIRRAMMQAGCTTAMLCGSGSTMFGLLEPQLSPDHIRDIMLELSSLGRVEISGIRSEPR